MSANWRPDMVVQVAFNANPNDPAAVPVWTDLSSGVGGAFLGADAVTRGRQYELDQNQASQPTLRFLDQYEYLNPANTSSPYYPNVVPYRQIIWQAMWNTAAGNPATGNLLNPGQGADSRLGTSSAGYDPSFESYANGATVPWITAVGSTTPTVTTTNPQQGTKDLTYTIAASSTTQGVSLVVPCIPGRQYTGSLYVRQSTASTQQITVGGQTAVMDAYRRTVSSGWGTADIGGPWSTSGGSASDYSVAAGVGMHELTSVNVSRKTVISSAVADADQTITVSTSVVAAGAAIRAGVMARYADASNYYRAVLGFNTDQTIDVRIVKRVAAAEATVASATTSLTHVAGAQYNLRFTVVGATLQARAWPAGATEPTTWDVDTTDSALIAAGSVGCHSTLVTGNTNTLPVTISFDNLTSVAALAGTSTTTTGSYVRLSVTWTAAQPTHILQVATVGAAVAGTVNVDAIQHEQAASASAFTASGPVIYGVFRGYVERWPASWEEDSAGYLGRCEATCVDSFGPLNRISLSSEYHSAIMEKEPDYYWSLNEAAGASTFGEQSGNSGPSLSRMNSKYGAASTFAAGTATDIPGDPSGTGLAVSGSGTSACSVIQTGVTNGSPVVVGGAGTELAYTCAVWIAHSAVTFSGQSLAVADSQYNRLIALQSFTGPARLQYASSSGTGGAGVLVADRWGDGDPHLYVGVTTISGADITVDFYVDGASVGTSTGPTAGMVAPFQTSLLELGGAISLLTGFTADGLPNGVYSHLALWNRALSTDEITDLFNAGFGYAGETSGTRVARYLSSGWYGQTSIDAGTSPMGASSLSSGTKKLAACQDVTTTENGNFWADRDGVTRFAGRQDRYLNLTSTYTFGENTAGGEYPYQEDVVFGYDPQFLWNTVTVNNANGVNVTVTDDASVTKYFESDSPSISVNTTDNEAISYAQWLVATHKDPYQRVASITLDPAAYPPLWPVVLGIEVNMRVTVARRPKAANGGAGITMSQDYFVESVSHDQVDMTGSWTTTLLLSPVPPVQPGILDDATYGILDQTMILAF